MSELCKLVCYIDSLVKTINSRRKKDAAQMNEKRQSHATDLEVGVVFHFSRSRGKQSRSGTPAAWGANSNSAPNDELNGTGYRYSGYYFENQKQAAALANLITTFPRTLELVRGVDLCSDELGIPLWVMKGLIDHVINSAEAAIRLVPDLRLRIKRALRITIHAGEDYVHLLGGIRRVSEALEFLPLHEGDRVGHAIALGVDVESWSMSVHTIPVTLEERLLDLIWLWRLAMRSTAIPELRAWIPWVREHLDQLSLRAFGNSGGPYSPAMLSEFQCMLHDPRTLREIGFPSGPMRNNFSSTSHEMIFKWITNRSLFRRIQQLIDVDVRAEASLIAAAQKQVRIDVGRLGIAIEINPSSNLLVGHIGSLEDHPLWRLRPIDRERLKSEPVRVCIGSDDPATFATSLANEYQLVFDAMTEAGYSSEECDVWINDVRQTGLDCRFTIPRSNHDLLIPVNYGSSPLYW